MRIFTRNCLTLLAMLVFGAIFSARAQTFTSKDVINQVGASAMCRDASGNIYVVETTTTYADTDPSATAQVVEYIGGGTTGTVLNGTSGIPFLSNNDGDAFAFGIAVDSNGNIYVSPSSSSANNNVSNNIIKFTKGSGNSYTANTSYIVGNTSSIGYFTNLVIDSNNNLWTIGYNYNDSDGGDYDLLEYTLGTSSGTLSSINSVELAYDAQYSVHSGDDFSIPTALAIDPSNNIYVATAYDETGGDGGTLYKLTYNSSNHTYSKSNLQTTAYCAGLGCDGSGNVFDIVNSPNSDNFSLAEFALGVGSPSTIFTGLMGTGFIFPTGVAASSPTNVFVQQAYLGSGGAEGNLYELIGPPATQASGVSFSSTTATGTTISWTDGSGSNRAVFVEQGTSGNPTLTNGTTYTANTSFNSGSTAGSGWYCVYNGSGTNVNITNLSPSTAYRAMVVEYNGTSTYTNYDTGTGSNNPNNVTTATPTIFVSGSPSVLSTPAGIASSSTNFTVSGTNLVANVTATAPSGFDISLNNSTWSGSGGNVSLTESGGTLGGTTVYVRLDAGDGVGPQSGNVALTSTSATTVNQAVSGTVLQPTLTVPGGTTTLSSTTSGTPGSSTSFNISASNLSPATGNITVTAPANVQVAPDNSTWNSSYTQSYSGSTLGSTPVYIRLAGTGSIGTISGNVQVSGGGATAVTQAVSGTLNSPSTTISSLTAVSSSLTNAASVQYTATFAASVTGLSAADFTLNTSGVSGASVASVSGSGTSWTVTVNTGSGDGTIQLEMNSSGSTSPSVSNLPFSGTTYTIDKTVPTVSIGAPSVNYANSSATISYTVTWSDANLNTSSISLSAAQLQFSGSGYAVNLGNVIISGSGATRTISIIGVTGNGSMSFSIPSGTASDNAGNSAEASNTSNAVVIDNTPPVVTIGAPSLTITNTGPVTFDVSYSDANLNTSSLSSSNITLNSTGGASASVAVIQNSPTDYTVTLSGITGNGSLGISVQPGTSSDLAGNTDAGAGPSTTFTVDNTPPSITSFTPTTPSNTNPTNSSTITYTITFSEPVTGVAAVEFLVYEVTGGVSYGTVTVTPVSSSVYTISLGGVTGNGVIELGFSNAEGYVTDLAGNLAPNYLYAAAYTIDNTPPTAAISAPSVASIGTGGSGTVTYTVTYADANFNTSNLTNAGITLNTTGTASGTVNVTGAGTSYTVTISSITGIGSLGITLAGGYATDLAGNTDLGAGPSATFNVLNNDATLSALGLSAGTLSPTFDPGTNGYTASVGNPARNFAVYPTTNDPSATTAVSINGTPVNNEGIGPLNIGSNTVTVTVTAADGVTTDTYTVTVTRAGSSDAYLAYLTVKGAALSPSFSHLTNSYTTTVSSNTTSVTVTPSVLEPNATVTVNNATVANKTASGPITLNTGDNTITVVVTAQDGVTTDTYTVTVTRPESSNANLSSIHTGKGYLVPGFTQANTSYNIAETYTTSSITVTPTTADPNATVTVNGATVTSGTASDPINLNIGSNTITLLVTAQDGTQNTYTLTVTRAASNDAYLASLVVSHATLSPAFAHGTFDYTSNVQNTTSSVTVTANVLQANATFTVNTSPATPQVATSPIALAVGPNVITIVVTAMDNVTTQTYTVTVTRAGSEADSYGPGISVTKPTESLGLADDGIMVHQGLSPNGDGINDFLQIDNIAQYPDNKLSIMNRNGQLVYEAKGYDNSSKVFDGHSNKNGQMQLPGTYFYALDYTVNGVTKHKTGFIVLKY